jgi:DNA-directed RNA polymerase subunit RPC12/RpoP
MKTPQSYDVDGKPVVCHHCGHREFHYRKTLLNTPTMSFLQLDWLNRTAHNYICAKCGHIMWFIRALYEPPQPPEAEEHEMTTEM